MTRAGPGYKKKKKKGNLKSVPEASDLQVHDLLNWVQQVLLLFFWSVYDSLLYFIFIFYVYSTWSS